MVAANITVADSDEQAEYLFTSTQQAFISMLTGQQNLLPPPIDHIEALLTPQIEYQLAQMLSCSIVGSPETVSRQLNSFVEKTGADEIIAVSSVYDQSQRLRSFGLLADIWQINR